METEELARRLAQLEAREAIRELKHRYLACCDAKDVAGFRDCFADGPVAIDYGPIGTFERADDLAAVFEEIACHPHMLEWHLPSNDRIELLDSGRARGRWSLHYQLIDTSQNQLTQLGGEYTDEYRLVGEDWKISATRFMPRSSLVLKLGEQAVSTVFAGSPPPSG